MIRRAGHVAQSAKARTTRTTLVGGPVKPEDGARWTSSYSRREKWTVASAAL